VALILFGKYRLQLPVGSLIILIYSTPPTAYTHARARDGIEAVIVE